MCYSTRRKHETYSGRAGNFFATISCTGSDVVGGLPLSMGPLIEGRLGLWNGLLDHMSIFSRSKRDRWLILVGNESAKFT